MSYGNTNFCYMSWRGETDILQHEGAVLRQDCVRLLRVDDLDKNSCYKGNPELRFLRHPGNLVAREI